MPEPMMRAAAPGIVAAVLCLAVLGWPAAAPAQNAVPAATEASQRSGVPDFSGWWQRANPLPSTFLLPDSGPGPVWDPQDHSVGGVLWLGDYSNPILKPHAADVIKARNEFLEGGGEDLPAYSLCWPTGVPQVLNLREPVQLLQYKDRVTILYQRDHQVRRIYLDRPHSQNLEPSWYGESVGHYEGKNTLVVDTIGLNAKTDVDKFGTPHTENIHVVERYILSEDGSMLTVDFTVEDPETFNMAWSAKATYRRTGGPVIEVICAENNKNASTGEDYPIPKAVAADF